MDHSTNGLFCFVLFLYQKSISGLCACQAGSGLLSYLSGPKELYSTGSFSSYLERGVGAHGHNLRIHKYGTST